MFGAETSDGVVLRGVVDAGVFHLAEDRPAVSAERDRHTRQGHEGESQRLWIAGVVTAQETYAAGGEPGPHTNLPRPKSRRRWPPGSEHPRRSEDAICLW